MTRPYNNIKFLFNGFEVANDLSLKTTCILVTKFTCFLCKNLKFVGTKN